MGRGARELGCLAGLHLQRDITTYDLFTGAAGRRSIDFVFCHGRLGPGSRLEPGRDGQRRGRAIIYLDLYLTGVLALTCTVRGRSFQLHLAQLGLQSSRILVRLAVRHVVEGRGVGGRC